MTCSPVAPHSLGRAITVHLSTSEGGCLQQGVFISGTASFLGLVDPLSHSTMFHASVYLMHSEEESSGDLSALAGVFALTFVLCGEERQKHQCSSGCPGQPAVGAPQDALLLDDTGFQGQKEKCIKVR